MTIEITGTLADGKFPRILHKGNMFNVKTVTASAEVASYLGIGANAGDTVDRWRPFANGLTNPGDFSGTDWTSTNVTIGSDNLTLAETTASGDHDISQSYTFTAVEHVVAFKIERQTVPEVQVRANDGTTSFTCFFDLRDGTVGTAANCTGHIIALGNNQYIVSIYFTPVAATGVVELLLANGSEAVSYSGSTANTLKVVQAYTHASEATLRYDLFTAQAGNCVGLAATNLWSSGTRLVLQHDSDNNDTWTDIATVVPSNNGPIMILFDAVTSSRWRIKVDRGVLPEVGVFRVGSVLKFERPFYAGFTVPRMSRNTEVRGNLSNTGQLLGRSKKRTVLNAEYSWNNLTYEWVRATLDGVNGLIQSVESEPLFVAWRPSETQDVEYLMRATVTAPQAQGTRDLHSFSMTGEAWAYE